MLEGHVRVNSCDAAFLRNSTALPTQPGNDITRASAHTDATLPPLIHEATLRFECFRLGGLAAALPQSPPRGAGGFRSSMTRGSQQLTQHGISS